jgi:hypothetical protein
MYVVVIQPAQLVMRGTDVAVKVNNY